MTCETGEAERRRGQDFNMVTKRTQPRRDLAGGQTGTFAEEHAHDTIPDIPGSLASGMTLERDDFSSNRHPAPSL
jgi:hypothetical protein